MILVVSAPSDWHARELMSRLTARGGNAVLLDLSEFPSRSAVTIDFLPDSRHGVARLMGESRTVSFEDCHVIWWRRPQPFVLDSEVTDVQGRSFALSEAYAAFSGLWLTLDAFWINHPTRDDEAARKVYQLKVARQVGLRIPETCITNSAEDAHRFIERHGPTRTVYKAFSGSEQTWRETRLLKPEEMAHLAKVQYAPVIFQEYIPAGIDLRITVVGERFFPAAIYSQETEYKVDFRMTMQSARFEALELPREVETQLRGLMNRLGLVYGAIDMRRTPEGEYIFLEINPSGQWLFVEERTGQPITEAMAELMLAHDTASP
jgi:hypothetical protein